MTRYISNVEILFWLTVGVVALMYAIHLWVWVTDRLFDREALRREEEHRRRNDEIRAGWARRGGR